METYKRNYLVYFYAYFAATAIMLYIHTYLPILFLRIYSIEEIEIVFVQIFSYSALFLKPVISIYFDKYKSKRGIIAIISAVGIILSFILLVINLTLLIIFSILLGLTFAFISLLDVIIDKVIIDRSLDEESKSKNILFTQLGALSGSIFVSVVYLIIMSDLYSIEVWNHFFLIGIISIAPIIFIMFLLKDNPMLNKSESKENIKDLEKSCEAISSSQKITNWMKNNPQILLMCLFLFLYSANYLLEWTLEPWILDQFGEEGVMIYTLSFIILVLINAFSMILASKKFQDLDRKKVIMISLIMAGILYAIAPFVGLIGFIILIAISQFFAGFLSIYLIAMVIDLSQEKGTYYQLMASFVVLAEVIFVPLGTYLSGLDFVSAQLLFVITGMAFIVSVIPIYYIKD